MKKIVMMLLILLLPACSSSEVALVIDNEGTIHLDYCTPGKGQLYIKQVDLEFAENGEQVVVKGELSEVANFQDDIKATMFLKFVFKQGFFNESSAARFVSLDLQQGDNADSILFEAIVDIPKIHSEHVFENMKRVEVTSFY